MLELRFAEASSLSIAVIGPAFRRFYAGPPWGERWRCPRCSPRGNFGPEGRHMAEDLERCPDCGTDLEEYWSDERVDEYFQSAMRRSGSWLIVGRLEGGELVGWTWGYDSCEVADLPEVGGTCTYVDVVGVMPEHRGSWAVVFFRRAHELLIDAGFSCLVTRTHKTARNVHLVMRVTGWERLDEASLADTEREFWIRRSEAT